MLSSNHFLTSHCYILLCKFPISDHLQEKKNPLLYSFVSFNCLGTHSLSPPCLSLRPSCPALFLPHPNTAPDKESAKLWSPPAVICARGIPARDFRGWGNSLLGSPFPSPSWPLVFRPHVNSWPSKWERTHRIHTSTTVLYYWAWQITFLLKQKRWILNCPQCKSTFQCAIQTVFSGEEYRKNLFIPSWEF